MKKEGVLCFRTSITYGVWLSTGTVLCVLTLVQIKIRTDR